MIGFNDYLDGLSGAKDTDELLTLFKSHLEPLGIDKFAYLNFSISENDAPICRHQYDDAWINRYFDKSYYDIDPVFEMGRRKSVPFQWTQSNDFSKPQQKFMSEAKEFDIKQGLTIPSRTAGFKTAFITLVSANSAKEFDNTLTSQSGLLHAMSLHFDARFSELHTPYQEITSPLTQRELECLKWAVKGKSNPDTAEIMHISEKTVEAHFTNIFSKLNVFNRTQAVVKALTLGLVCP